MTIFPLILSIFALAGAHPVPVNCTPGSPGSIAGVPEWGIATIGQPGEGDHIDVYGRVGCLSIIFLESTPAEQQALIRLNPGLNFPRIVADGLLLDLHEAEHFAIYQQHLAPGGYAAEECLDGQRTDAAIGRLVAQAHVPRPWLPAVKAEIERYDSSILDWTGCPGLIGYTGPDPQLP